TAARPRAPACDGHRGPPRGALRAGECPAGTATARSGPAIAGRPPTRPGPRSSPVLPPARGRYQHLINLDGIQNGNFRLISTGTCRCLAYQTARTGTEVSQ